MQDIIAIVARDDLRVDSRQLSPALDTRHRETIALIRKYRPQMERLGRLPFEKAPLQTAGGLQHKSIRALARDRLVGLVPLLSPAL